MLSPVVLVSTNVDTLFIDIFLILLMTVIKIWTVKHVCMFEFNIYIVKDILKTIMSWVFGVIYNNCQMLKIAYG
jgi:hypothetical protein